MATPSVTKTFNLVFQGISISPDGAQITASVGWQDQSTPTDGSPASRVPVSFSNVRIVGGKVLVANKDVGAADPQIATHAAAACAAVKAIVDGLVTAGKLVP